MAYSATCVHQVNTKTPLLTLPPELILKILGDLQDIEPLFATILACRRLFDIFQEAQRPLIESAFVKCRRLKPNRGIYRALIQLRQIIQRDIVQRDVVRYVFETGWELFRQKNQEELLIPFGRALAWSYVLDDRQADAVCLLQLILEGKPPFGWSRREISLPPIQPIRQLLEQLVSEGNEVDTKYISPFMDSRLVEIKIRSKEKDPFLNNIEQANLLKDGILFRKNSIVMRSKPYSLLTYHRHIPRHAFFLLCGNN